MKRYFYIQVVIDGELEGWLGEYGQYTYQRSCAHIFDQVDAWMLDEEEYVIEELPECQQLRRNNCPALLDLSLYDEPAILTEWGGGATTTPA